MEQMTEEQARQIFDSGVWRDWDDDTVVQTQLFQDRLLLPFDRFHEAVEHVLGRPVFTHEFARLDLLRAEYLGLRPAPSLEEIMGLLPHPVVMVVMDPKNDTDDIPFVDGVWTRRWRKPARALWEHEDGLYRAYLFEEFWATTAWTVSHRGTEYRKGVVSNLDTAKSQALAAVAELKEDEAQRGQPDHPAYPLLASAYAVLEGYLYRGLSSSIGCVINALWYGRTDNAEGVVTVGDALRHLLEVVESLPGTIERAPDEDQADDLAEAAGAVVKAIWLIQDGQTEEVDRGQAL
jgi:hypothetical protein